MTARVAVLRNSRNAVLLLTVASLVAAFLAVVLKPAAAHAAGLSQVTGPAVTTVSRSTDKLDAFGVDAEHRIYTMSWEPAFTDGWHRGGQLNGGVAAPGTSVYGVSRSTDKLDVFAVGTDRKVYTAAWEPAFGDAWHGWWQLPGITVAPNTSVHAVSRSLNRLDIFAVGSDLRVYTAGWSASTGWSAWSSLGLTVAANTTVFGVVRGPGKIDLLAVASNRGVVTAAWDDAVPGWRGWWSVAGGVVAPDTSVFGVSRSRDHIDVFAVGTDSKVYTAAWEPAFGASWHGWWGVQNFTAAPGTTVFGSVRSTDHIDIFAVGTDRGTYTAAWEPAFTDGFHGWWNINGGVVAPGTSVYGVSRSLDHLDIFAIGTDNATYTAAWEPAFGATWGGWWRLRDGGLNRIILSASMNFDNGVTVSGNANLSLFPDGSFNFSGHFHDSGLLSYNVSMVWAVRSSAGTVFLFSTQGHLAGTLEPGSRDHNWNTSGSNPAIAAAWSDLRNGYNWSWQAKAAFDLAALWSTIKTTIGVVTQVVAIVGPLL